jgi:hypothetical protein
MQYVFDAKAQIKLGQLIRDSLCQRIRQQRLKQSKSEVVLKEGRIERLLMEGFHPMRQHSAESSYLMGSISASSGMLCLRKVRRTR